MTSTRTREFSPSSDSAFRSHEEIKSFLKIFSQYNGDEDDIFLLLINAQSVSSLTKNQFVEPSTRPIHRTDTIMDLERPDQFQQKLEDFSRSSRRLLECSCGTRCHAKYSNKELVWEEIPKALTFKDISAIFDNNPDRGFIVCCYDMYRETLGLPEQNMEKYKNAGMKTSTADLLSYGGYYTSLHLDIGGTSRRHKLLGNLNDCAKLLIILKSTNKKTHELMKKVTNSWTSQDDRIDTACEIKWIVQNRHLFLFVLQRVGQEVEHCGMFYHAFLTFVNPIANPKGLCFSYGYTIGSDLSLLRFVDHAPGSLIAYQDGPFMKQVDIGSKKARRNFEKEQAKSFSQKPAATADKVEILRTTQREASMKAKVTKDVAKKRKSATQFKSK